MNKKKKRSIISLSLLCLIIIAIIIFCSVYFTIEFTLDDKLDNFFNANVTTSFLYNGSSYEIQSNTAKDIFKKYFEAVKFKNSCKVSKYYISEFCIQCGSNLLILSGKSILYNDKEFISIPDQTENHNKIMQELIANAILIRK